MFRRSAGAPLIGGNQVRVLRDAAENYPAWEQAIRGDVDDSRRDVHHPPRRGRPALRGSARRARPRGRQRARASTTGSAADGVRFSASSGRSSRPAAKCASSIRRALSAALGWTTRNHRKYICVDGRVAFVAGLCVGRMWVGRPEKTSGSVARHRHGNHRARRRARRTRLCARAGAWPAAQIDPPSRPVEAGIAAGRHGQSAADLHRAVHRGDAARRSARRRDGAPAAVDRRRLLRRARSVRRGAAARGARRRRRAPAAAARQRRRLDRAGLAHAVPHAARRRASASSSGTDR